jgi:hypothetical protein
VFPMERHSEGASVNNCLLAYRDPFIWWPNVAQPALIQTPSHTSHHKNKMKRLPEYVIHGNEAK